jgi:hypothetical protein
VIRLHVQVKPSYSKPYYRDVVALYHTGIVKTILPPFVGKDVAGVKEKVATLVLSLAPTIFKEFVTTALVTDPGAKFMLPILLDVSAYVD